MHICRSKKKDNQVTKVCTYLCIVYKEVLHDNMICNIIQIMLMLLQKNIHLSPASQHSGELSQLPFHLIYPPTWLSLIAATEYT